MTNSVPYAYSDGFGTLHDTPYSGSVFAEDDDYDPVTYALDTSPQNGTIDFQDDGTFTYTPNESFVGSDSFSFTASDGIDTSEPAWVWIEVWNTAPTATDEHHELRFWETATFTLAGEDLDGDEIEISIVSAPEHGSYTAVVGTENTYEYQPDAGYQGPDRIEFEVTDGIETVTGEITFNVSNPLATANPTIEIVTDYSDSFVLTDANLIEVTEEGKAIYGSSVPFKVTAEVENDSGEPFQLQLWSIADGTLISETPLSSGSPDEHFVSLNTGLHASVGVRAVIVHETTQSVLLQVEGEESVSPVVQPLSEYVEQLQQETLQFSRQILAQTIDQVVDGIFTEDHIQQWVQIQYAADPAGGTMAQYEEQYRERIATLKDTSYASLDPLVVDTVSRLFGGADFTIEIRAGGNNPGRNGTQNYFDELPNAFGAGDAPEPFIQFDLSTEALASPFLDEDGDPTIPDGPTLVDSLQNVPFIEKLSIGMDYDFHPGDLTVSGTLGLRLHDVSFDNIETVSVFGSLDLRPGTQIGIFFFHHFHFGFEAGYDPVEDKPTFSATLSGGLSY